jgi:hypothetical protein
VKVQLERRAFVGETSERAPEHGGSWSGLMMLVTERTVLGSDSLVDVRRRLFLAGGAPDTSSESTDDAQWLAAYHEWLGVADLTADATLTQPLDGHDEGAPAAVLLSSLKVPTRISTDPGQVPEGTSRVELLPQEAPWVGGRNYPVDDVRVVLVPQGDRWVASIRQVGPYSLEALAEMLGFVPSTGARRTFGRRMYFAGLTDDDDFRFEWGFGQTVVVPRRRLSVGERPADDESFFFGDQVTRFRLECVPVPAPAPAPAAVELRLCVENVKWEIERWVWSDAKEGLLQQLTVRVDPARNSVRLHEVVTRAGALVGGHQGQYRQDQRLRLRNGSFDPTSVDDIIQAARASGRWREHDEGPLTVTVLARLDQPEQPTARRRLRFSYLTAARGAAANRSLAAGDALFMIAGPVERKPVDHLRISNDCLIRFSLPSDLLGAPPEGLAVTVMRRDFSLRESVLRALVDVQPIDDDRGRDRYVGHPMMVRLLPRRDEAADGWRGSTVDAPHRALAAVQDWAKGPDPAYVTVGARLSAARDPGRGSRGSRVVHWKDGLDRLVVEIGPGVMAALPWAPRRPAPKSGTTAVLVADDDAIRLDPVVDGDAAYLGSTGRAVVLLPKDHVLKRSPDRLERDPVDRSREKDFSVAGLPSVQVSDKAAAVALNSSEHPRLAVVRSGAGGSLVVDLTGAVRAATFRVDRAHQPLMTWRRGEELGVPEGLGWRQLSFLDASSADVAWRVKHAAWTYHDISTGHWIRTESSWRFQPRRFAPQLTALVEPVFFDDRWSLRYRGHELRSFGYPPRELLDRPTARSTTYAVAADAEEGAWIESSPGRVVHLPGRMVLPFARSGDTLGAFRWLDLSAGDELVLGPRTETGRLAPLVLETWRPGPRGFFGRRTLLPVTGQHHERKALTLGTGIAQLTVPCSAEELIGHPEGSQRWLHEDGRITDPALDRAVGAGDHVLLAVTDEGRFTVPGRPDLLVRLAATGWDHAEWIRAELDSADRRGRFLALLGGVLPVAVVASSSLGGEQTLVDVARSLPLPADRRPDGAPELILGQALGLLDERNALVRAGRSLLRVDPATVVAGAGDPATVIATLRDARIPLWLHATDVAPAAGLRAVEPDDGEIDVVAVLAVAGGVVCREVTGLALHWLPTERAGWVSGLDPTALLHELARRDDVRSGSARVRVLPGGEVSLVDTTASRLVRDRLTVGARLRVQLIGELGLGPRGRYRYLGRIYPDGGLLEVHAETEQQWASDDDPLRCEVQACSAAVVSVVHAGDRRTRLDLPAWIPRALGPVQVLRGTPDRARRFAEAVPERFAAYHAAARAAAAGEKPWQDEALCGGARLVGLCYAMSGPDAEQLHDTVGSQLAAWLSLRGSRLLGTDVVSADDPAKEDDDLAVYLAVVLLLHHLQHSGDRARDASWGAVLGRASVHAARQLGRLAAGSLHVEALLDRWLLAGDAGTKAGQWLRLGELSLAGTVLEDEDDTGEPVADERYAGLLTPRQAEQVRFFTAGVLGRAAIVADEDLLTVAAALAHAIGDDDHLADLVSRTGRSVTGRLAALARGLATSSHTFTAQPRLLPPQVDLLVDALDEVLRNDLPVGVLAHNAPPRGPEEGEHAARSLRELTRVLRRSP